MAGDGPDATRPALDAAALVEGAEPAFGAVAVGAAVLDAPPVSLRVAGATFEHAASVPRIAAVPRLRATDHMWVILLEALGALVALVLIVWWTMFHGRDRGERK